MRRMDLQTRRFILILGCFLFLFGCASAPKPAPVPAAPAPKDVVLNKPGVATNMEENLLYRVNLFWENRVTETLDVCYALEDAKTRKNFPNLTKYIMRQGKSPKDYRKSEFKSIRYKNKGKRAYVMLYQEFYLKTPMLQAEMMNDIEDMWVLEDGNWYRAYIDFTSLFRKMTGFDTEEESD